MNSKYIFVTGGVVSGLGKGITAASLGRLLKARGLKVTMQKFDPYLNIDPGTMSPYQHGEVFVTEDGAETDLDLGHYERFIDENLNKESNITSGKVYYNVLQKERAGLYQGTTVQVIPHITNEIKEKLLSSSENAQINIVEIGGTVGDIESQPFLEAIRQFAIEQGKQNCLFIHVTLVPYLKASSEQKTKPTQHSVKELLMLGIQPDIIILRADREIAEEQKQKIALFCNVANDCVVQNLDLPLLYQVPLALHEEKLDETVCKKLGLDTKGPDLAEWMSLCSKASSLEKSVTVTIVGKYIELPDAYLSVIEALTHGGIANDCKVKIEWLDSEQVTEQNAPELFKNTDGILVPGGFGIRGVEGKINSIHYARVNNIPFLGICLGMQLSVVEFARYELGLKDAHSAEFDPQSQNHVIDILPNQLNVTDLGGTLRLGAYPCKISKNTLAYEIYKDLMDESDIVQERHRHRYEVNSEYQARLEEKGLIFSGQSPDGRILEMIEIKNHKFYIAAQFHPEFKSRPNKAHPIFKEFIKACAN